jgi:hypothetical protein
MYACMLIHQHKLQMLYLKTNYLYLYGNIILVTYIVVLQTNTSPMKASRFSRSQQVPHDQSMIPDVHVGTMDCTRMPLRVTGRILTIERIGVVLSLRIVTATMVARCTMIHIVAIGIVGFRKGIHHMMRSRSINDQQRSATGVASI